VNLGDFRGRQTLQAQFQALDIPKQQITLMLRPTGG